jgi:hypothetical protein
MASFGGVKHLGSTTSLINYIKILSQISIMRHEHVFCVVLYGTYISSA